MRLLEAASKAAPFFFFSLMFRFFFTMLAKLLAGDVGRGLAFCFLLLLFFKMEAGAGKCFAGGLLVVVLSVSVLSSKSVISLKPVVSDQPSSMLSLSLSSSSSLLSLSLLSSNATDLLRLLPDATDDPPVDDSSPRDTRLFVPKIKY